VSTRNRVKLIFFAFHIRKNTLRYLVSGEIHGPGKFIPLHKDKQECRVVTIAEVQYKRLTRVQESPIYKTENGNLGLLGSATLKWPPSSPWDKVTELRYIFLWSRATPQFRFFAEPKTVTPAASSSECHKFIFFEWTETRL
jgi:hypothetical protein